MDFNSLDFKNIEKREKRLRLISNLLSASLIVFGIFWVYNSNKKVSEAQEKLSLVKEEIKYSEKYVDSLSRANETLHKRYEKLNELFKVYDWKPEVLKDADSIVIEQAIKANQEILRVLDSDEKMNYNIAIRYYVKKLDRDKVKTALRRTGYRDILFDNDSWRSKIPSNRISFDNKVEIKDIKLIALSLLREGVQLKKISFYPKRVLRRRTKANSIEIFGDKKLIEEPSLTYLDIITLDKDNLEFD